MNQLKKKHLNLFIILFILVFLLLFFYVFINQSANNAIKAKEPITINLLTSVHPSLSWSFKSLDNKIIVEPGEVTTIEYIVENLKDKESTGIATFAYFPNQFGDYIRKLNCFCYDAQTLKSKERSKFSVVILIDPEVTKDSMTKNTKEVTIQFTFFDYKQYKGIKS